MIASPRRHHFTASGLVLAHEHVLLVNHRRIGAWVPPGGHVEEFELPHQTVVREIVEETGVVVEVLGDRVPAESHPDAIFLSSPLYMQRVSAIERGEEFYHIDLAFLCRPLWLPGQGQLFSTGQAPPGDQRDGDPFGTEVKDVAASDKPPGSSRRHEVKEVRWVRLSELDTVRLADNVAQAIALAVSKLAQYEAEERRSIVKPPCPNPGYNKHMK